MSSKTQTVTRQESSSNFCHICCHESDLFCIGPCEHPICFECGVRMRVICESKECPICRSEVKTMLVVFADRRMPYSKYKDARLVFDSEFKRYGLKFENTEALNAVKDILAHVCTVCDNEPEFRNFDDLSHHMRRNHELFYCDLCATNLQLFSWERKCYTREELAKHRRVGDPDDRSHRGHPLCEFCDQRYVDDEQLYRHLRRDHYFCHFCDADGANKFYPTTDELKKHMKSDHFLCEDGQCKEEPLGISFRHEIDFKAHKASTHGAKQERYVNVNFDIRRGGGVDRERSYRDRDNVRIDKERQHSKQSGSNRRDGTNATRQRSDLPSRSKLKKAEDIDENDPDLSRALEVSQASAFALKTEEFPSLSPYAGTSTSEKAKDKKSMANFVALAAGLSTKAGSLDEGEFPSLPINAKTSGQMKKKQTNGDRQRRNSRSASPTKNLQTRKNFMMVDDDEEFPSVTEQVRSQEVEASTKESSNVGPQKAAEESGLSKHKTSAPKWGRSTATGFSQAKGTAWNSKDEAFPALVSSTGRKAKSPTKAANSSLVSKPWAQLLAEPDPGDIKKEETKKASKPKKDAPSPSSMATDALLEALPPGLPIRAKARQVAQRKQRPSECIDDGHGQKPLPDQTIAAAQEISSAPPPGFENVMPNSISPPPGFESNVPSQSGSSTQTNGMQVFIGITTSDQYQYKKPSNFDARNRALFDRLRALMNNDENSIQEFKKASSEYRHGEMDAAEYRERVRQLLNDDGAYIRIFSELVCLLPDIQRQNALWDAFRNGSTAIGALGPASNDTVKRCSRCGQLLMKMDYYEHAQYAHPMKGMNKSRYDPEEYPALY